MADTRLRLYVCASKFDRELFPERFRKAEHDLRGWGYAAMGHMREDEDEAHEEEMMRRISALLASDGVALLDGYEDDDDAILECKVADAIGIPRLTLDMWGRMAKLRTARGEGR